jgi:hypothetical protein
MSLFFICMFWSFKANDTLFTWVIYKHFYPKKHAWKLWCEKFVQTALWLRQLQFNVMWQHSMDICAYWLHHMIPWWVVRLKCFLLQFQMKHNFHWQSDAATWYRCSCTGALCDSLMSTDEISSWHNFHQCTISVENTTEVECDVGMHVHANRLHHDSLINIKIKAPLDKI